MDDFASHPLLKNKEAILPRFLKKLRHYHINVIICVQNTKAIPKELRRDLDDCIMFSGINEDDFKIFVRESTLGQLGAPTQLWNQYSKIKCNRTMMIFHMKADTIIIREPIKC